MLFYYPSISTQLTTNKTDVYILKGEPAKLKIYTSINNKKFYLCKNNSDKKWNQFKPTLCDQIKLEFIEVTNDSLTSNETQAQVTRGIAFIQASIDKKKKKNHEDDNYQ